ncbi:MAG: hypothetical protein A2Y62_04065 [Candidatus Fischerbacteria bacterium RBG_13_37_8]|uniref:DUF4845 domain-containing protein n=1 Tax=Candidatus Fischerbacteria bacterium RBG_13_37_8 TaxID=1817863 RepID=A0A1F5V4R0_9BACT|nr:MAG: hypothetical protein A2Y62_04065 [Candidatus Fischerbacteria bacterium RBG_13_37_8]
MRINFNQKGSGKFGVLVATIIVILLIYAIVKYMPVKLNAYEFQDYMEKIARDPYYSNEKLVRSALLQKASEMRIPLQDSDIKVSISQAGCDIDVRYKVTIETPFMKKTLDFNPRVSEKRIY